jgi:hypothetical protein
MATFYFTVQLDHDRTLCLAPLTDRRYERSGQELDDTSGYFLFEQRGFGEAADIEIIARAISDEAALRLRQMFNMV